VTPKALATMKERVRQITRRNGGRSIPSVATELRGYLTGWKEYFRLADTPGIFRDLDGWIRHRLRTLQLKQWKRGATIYRELRARGLSDTGARKVAVNARRWCRNARMLLHVALPIAHYDALAGC
ncbi:MAG: group II intron maturase-specific domain-containing protein, partial [Candidatus Binataceae bacterium]